eukprot:4290492-Pyramimonas_sp.AAC.1
MTCSEKRDDQLTRERYKICEQHYRTISNHDGYDCNDDLPPLLKSKNKTPIYEPLQRTAKPDHYDPNTASRLRAQVQRSKQDDVNNVNLDKNSVYMSLRLGHEFALAPTKRRWAYTAKQNHITVAGLPDIYPGDLELLKTRLEN